LRAFGASRDLELDSLILLERTDSAAFYLGVVSFISWMMNNR